MGSPVVNNVLHPVNQLSITRTILANERTLLSYLRGSVGCLLGGIGLIKFLDHPVYLFSGSVLLVFSVILFVVGLKRFRSVKKLISEIDPVDWLVVEQRIVGTPGNRGRVSARAQKTPDEPRR